MDGSRWKQAEWQCFDVTIRQHNVTSQWTTAEMMVLEMESLSVLRHPNILLLMATCSGPMNHNLLLVVEPVQTYSLFQLLHKNEQSNPLWQTRVDVVCAITKGKGSWVRVSVLIAILS